MLSGACFAPRHPARLCRERGLQLSRPLLPACSLGLGFHLVSSAPARAGLCRAVSPGIWFPSPAPSCRRSSSGGAQPPQPARWLSGSNGDVWGGSWGLSADGKRSLHLTPACSRVQPPLGKLLWGRACPALYLGSPPVVQPQQCCQEDSSPEAGLHRSQPLIQGPCSSSPLGRAPPGPADHQQV